jgi:ribosomal protein S18 acetylase RimI-like enzyme
VPPTPTETVVPLDESQAAAAAAVLVDAFRDYPALRFVLGSGGEYRGRLQALIGLFVKARFARKGPVLGLRDETGELVAVATVTVPDQPEPSASFAEWRDQLWRELGEDAHARYGRFAAAIEGHEHAAPHHHLNMIGVRRTHQGRGYAGALLHAVHAVAAAHPGSAGVGLNTEVASNVKLYERFGYRELGHARVSDELETWVMFRPKAQAR